MISVIISIAWIQQENENQSPYNTQVMQPELMNANLVAYLTIFGSHRSSSVNNASKTTKNDKIRTKAR